MFILFLSLEMFQHLRPSVGKYLLHECCTAKTVLFCVFGVNIPFICFLTTGNFHYSDISMYLCTGNINHKCTTK